MDINDQIDNYKKLIGPAVKIQGKDYFIRTNLKSSNPELSNGYNILIDPDYVLKFNENGKPVEHKVMAIVHAYTTDSNANLIRYLEKEIIDNGNKVTSQDGTFYLINDIVKDASMKDEFKCFYGKDSKLETMLKDPELSKFNNDFDKAMPQVYGLVIYPNTGDPNIMGIISFAFNKMFALYDNKINNFRFLNENESAGDYVAMNNLNDTPIGVHVMKPYNEKQKRNACDTCKNEKPAVVYGVPGTMKDPNEEPKNQKPKKLKIKKSQPCQKDANVNGGINPVYGVPGNMPKDDDEDAF